MNESLNFAEAIIEEDFLNRACNEGINTRFPPESGRISASRSCQINCLNFGFPLKYQGRVNLRLNEKNGSDITRKVGIILQVILQKYYYTRTASIIAMSGKDACIKHFFI